jgi:hypothetical protein
VPYIVTTMFEVVNQEEGINAQVCLVCTATWLCVLAERSTQDAPVIAATQVLAWAVARSILSHRQSDMAGLQHHGTVSAAGERSWGSTGVYGYFNSCTSAVLQMWTIIRLPKFFISNLNSARYKLICIKLKKWCSIYVLFLYVEGKRYQGMLMFCWPCIIVYQYSETNVMHFLFSLLRIKGFYMFRALLAHLQEELLKRHLVYCMRVTSVGCTRVQNCIPLQSWCNQLPGLWHCVLRWKRRLLFALKHGHPLPNYATLHLRRLS